MMTVQFAMQHAGSDVPPPAFSRDDAAGMTVCAVIPSMDRIAPGQRLTVPLGFAVRLPPGLVALLYPTERMAKAGITIAPVPVDAGNTGWLFGHVNNTGDTPFTIERGMPIGTMIFAPALRPELSMRGA